MVMVIEMVEILDGRLRLVFSCVIHTLSHCEIWSYFTHSIYFHLPSARDNTDTLVKYLVIFMLTAPQTDTDVYH